MQLPVVGNAFYGRNRRLIFRDGQGEATQNPFAVAHNRTSAALTMIAAFFGAGQMQMMTQGIQQTNPRRQLKLS